MRQPEGHAGSRGYGKSFRDLSCRSQGLSCSVRKERVKEGGRKRLSLETIASSKERLQ